MTSPEHPYPLGKLPPDVLAALLSRYPNKDPRVVVGPRPGEDAAVLDIGDMYLVAKTDPITFATDEIGWYVVNINANDIATMGAKPAWFMTTLLLPGGKVTQTEVETIFEQIASACEALNVTMIGGHTEMTYGLDRPIAVGVMLGTVAKDRLVVTAGAQSGDVVIVTKGAPIEATAIIVREKAAALKGKFSQDFIERCAGYLHKPGISVVRDAEIATGAGRVHAMHDPTEGGLITGLWELAESSGKRLRVEPTLALLEDGKVLCAALKLDPLGSIASGALLMTVHPDDAEQIMRALAAEGIITFDIGRVEDGPVVVTDRRTGQTIPKPARDEIARLFE